jgi:CRP-like cAMP-binding protein
MEKGFQKFIDYYSSLSGNLNLEEVNFFEANFSVQRFHKKEFFLKSGSIQRVMGFVVKGLFRRYYIDENGKEITSYFLNENNFVTDYPAFIKQQPTKFYIEALEPTLIMTLSYQKIQEGYSRFKNFEKFGRLIAEDALIIQTKRIENFLFMKPEERYLDFIKNNNGIMDRISLSHLSSLLGIERQSLSRIRKRITQK